ncbi:NAD(P)-dependent oxidoreductase [Paenibacillus sp. JMULE4]|uniref:NAD(P)-dependent oxidoreductase n=1 Tax=Paenibacillus sp. JMULE4 TaxID=2518342 RepID=UPI0026726613|nr:NAD(P)-dependent oxidoreductase [Paenibacillus sp. JMULE4]NTZ19985.1 NAD(P)-dependent oxidoreductase [Paenibacillus sp. JMULE4]
MKQKRDNMKIGFAGLGRMGFAMAQRLLQAGVDLTVWNRTKSKAQDLLDQGAKWAETPLELTENCEILFSMVADDQAVKDMYTSEAGLLQGGLNGKLFIEMSTVHPATIRELAEMICQKGGSLIDSPVSGTVVHAREGSLIALMGGDEESISRAKPVLGTFCKSMKHIGPVGTGMVMKLVLNMPMNIYSYALSEALAIGVKAGIDLKSMLEFIAESPAGIKVLPVKIPAILQATEEVSFDIKGVKKDLANMISAGQFYGVPTPAASITLLSYTTAVADGWGDRDWGAIVPYFIEKVLKM